MPHLHDEDVQFLTTWQVNDLPDSSFAILMVGGRKDEEGRTFPRAKRLLPYLDSSGTLIEPEALRSLSKLNEMNGILGLTVAMRVDAWNKIVKAIKAHRKKHNPKWPDFVPPPRKF